MFSPDDITPWATMAVAICGALIGFGTILGFLYVQLPRGKQRFGSWVHEVSGANAVSAKVQGLTDQLGTTNVRLTEIGALQQSHHAENRATAAEHDRDIGSLTSAQDRTSVALKALTEEQMAEAEIRTTALAQMTVSLEKIAVMADEALSHARSRKKHPNLRPSSKGVG